ncbi:MAG: oligosaccharide flippase family protein [Bacteroides sp.]|nr:oligosaccharide flippase family protein [Bacteroides sp.]
MKNNGSFFRNTVILFAAMFITKVIGALLKIPLTNMMGGTGMGYFSTAYSFFNPVYTVLAAGLPITVTRMTAQSAARKRYRETRKIKSAALAVSAAAGIFGTLFMLLFASPFAKYAAGSPESLWAAAAIAPSVLFCCVAAAYRGYYEGLYDMLPTAVSQVTESAVKAILGLGLAGTVICLGDKGVVPDASVLPLAAAAAVLGTTVGELCGTLSLMIRSRAKSDGITEEELEESPEPPSAKEIIKRIVKDSLPISLGAVIINLGSFIDLLTISGGIQECFVKNQPYFADTYALAIKESGFNSFGNFVYGSYTGIVLSMFMIITSLTALIGKSALPQISAAYERKNGEEVKRNISILLSGVFVIGLPLCLSLGALAEPVLSILYPVRAAEVSVSVMPMTVLCFGGIPIALCGGLFAVFQAIGRFDLPIKLMMAGSASKLMLNLLLLRIPYASISGAAVSTVVSHIIVMTLGIASLRKTAGTGIKIFPLFAKPFAAAFSCAVTALLSYYLLFNNFTELLRMGLTVCTGGAVYIILILLLDRRIVYAVFRRKKEKTLLKAKSRQVG